MIHSERLHRLDSTVSDAGLVKICGLRTEIDVEAAVAAGADLVGFVLAPSRRQIDAETVARITRSVRAQEVHPPLVGVFVDATETELNRAAEHAQLDYLQLHGDEPPALLPRLERPVIKSFSAGPEATVDKMTAQIEPFFATVKPPEFILIDAFVPGQRGGTGVEANWQVAAELATQFPLILAGGLAPENVGGAIERVSPLGVDVSSGVETDGVKDRGKMVAFVEESRRTFAGRAARASSVRP